MSSLYPLVKTDGNIPSIYTERITVLNKGIKKAKTYYDVLFLLIELLTD
jgi:hypothetical protein